MVAALVVLVSLVAVVLVLVSVAEAVETEKLFFSAWSEIFWAKKCGQNISAET